MVRTEAGLLRAGVGIRYGMKKNWQRAHVEERREIDRATVDETRAAILELGRRACIQMIRCTKI